MREKRTLETFIRDANLIHNNFYDYSKVIYTRMKDNVTIICPIHGEFQQPPERHTLQKSGCKQCGRERSELAKYTPFEKVLQKAKEIHKDTYDYSLIIDYKDTRTKVPIICKVHGVFYQNFLNHNVGKGCNKCGYIKGGINGRVSQEEALERCLKTHGDKFNYPDFNYTTEKTKIPIECPQHGIFYQTLNNHWKGAGCPSCKHEKAKGVYNKTLAKRNKEEWLTIPAIVYYVKFTSDTEVFWKVGITVNTVDERFSMYSIPRETVKVVNTNLYDAVFIEDEIMEKYKQYKFTPESLRVGKTECFSEDVWQ